MKLREALPPATIHFPAIRGVPGGINVKVGDPLPQWPTGFYTEVLDWFDNDVTCTWTLGDDLHLEDLLQFSSRDQRH